MWFEEEGEAGEGEGEEDVGAEAAGVMAKTMPFEVEVAMPAAGSAVGAAVGAAEGLGRMVERRRGARGCGGVRVDVGISKGRGARIAASGWRLRGRERRWGVEDGKETRAFWELQVRFWALKRERRAWLLRGREKFFWAAERRRGRVAPRVALW